MQTALKSRPRSAPALLSAKTRRTRSITDLYAEFEKAHAIFSKLNQDCDTSGDASHERLERAVSRCNRISNQLVRTSAMSIAEILLKLRIVGWQHQLDRCDISLEQFDEWKHTSAVEETEAARVLAGLHADLRRLAAH